MVFITKEQLPLQLVVKHILMIVPLRMTSMAAAILL